MTREEIIGGLKFTIEMFLLNPNTNETRTRDSLNDLDKTTVDACEEAIKYIEAWDKVLEEYNNLLSNGETKGSSDYWQGVEDMWNIIRKEI